MIKQILITGGAGFIGSHLARALADAGHRVRILDNFAAQVHGDQPRIPAMLGSEIEVITGDVRSRHDLMTAMRGINAVYHFAASVGVGQSMYEVRSYVDNNNIGTANLLQYLIEHPVERLVVASSMSIYGEGLYRAKEGRPYAFAKRELPRLQQRDWEARTPDGELLTPVPTPESKQPDLASIYALSKFDQERMCLMIGQAYRIPTVALRFFNVYGPGQALSNPYTGVMAIFASRLLNDASPLVFEDGNQMRDFVHVSDVIQACCLALEVPEASGNAFNIGSGIHYSIREIATRMALALGKGHIAPEITNRYRVGDIRHCFADITLAREVLGYQPKITLNDGLEDLTAWLSRQRAIDRSTKAQQELLSKGLAI